MADLIEEPFPEADTESVTVLPDDLFPEPVTGHPLVPAIESGVVDEPATVAAVPRTGEPARVEPTHYRAESPAEAFVAQGIGFLDEKKAREASECFTKAIALDPSNRTALARRADAYDQMGRRASASGDRRRAAAIE